MWQLVYATFITNNHDSFHLRWQENLEKQQKVLKYYGQDYSENILLRYVFSLKRKFLTLEKRSNGLYNLVHHISKLKWKETFSDFSVEREKPWEGGRVSHDV